MRIKTVGPVIFASALLLVACKQSTVGNAVHATETVPEAPADLLSLMPAWKSDPWDYAKLEALIKSEDLRTVDAVLARLPKWLQTSFTMIHTSGDGEEGTSYETPRVLLFSPDAKFILSYNANPAIHRLRIAQFDDDAARLSLRQISFDAKGATAAKFEGDNDGECGACHGEDAGYLIEEYDTWTGWYGSKDDSFVDGSKEDLGLQALRKRAKEDARLMHLSFPEQFPNYPYHRFDQQMGKNSVGRGFSSMPNTRLTTAIMRLQARIVHRRLKSGADYATHAPKLAYAMLEPKADVIQYRAQKVATCDAVLGGPVADRYKAIQEAFTAAGVPYDDMDTGGALHSITGRSRTTDPGTRLFMDGFFSVRDIVLDLIWRDLSASSATLAAFHEPIDMSDGIAFAQEHWGAEERYNRDYHFRPEQRQVFDAIATAMISPKGNDDESFKKACEALREAAGQKPLVVEP